MSRDQQLTVELVDDRLVISIGVDTLMIAAQGADAWDDDRLRITDPAAFADEIVRGLEDEEEDGTTRVHLAIDSAIEWALEQGCEGVAYDESDDA